MQEIEFTIHPDGKVEYTIRGIKGSGCEELEALFKELGQTQVSKPTSEFYEIPPEQHTRQYTGHQ